MFRIPNDEDCSRFAHGLLTVCYVPFRVPNVPFEVPNVPFRVLGMFAHALLTLCSRFAHGDLGYKLHDP